MRDALLIPALGVAAFGGAWLQNKSQRVKVKHVAFVTTMVWLVGIGLWLTGDNKSGRNR